jgi:hypothetical protein
MSKKPKESGTTPPAEEVERVVEQPKPARKRKESPIRLYRELTSSGEGNTAYEPVGSDAFATTELAEAYVKENRLEGTFEVHAVKAHFTTKIRTVETLEFA